MAEVWQMYAVRLQDGLLHYVHSDQRSTAMYGVTPVLEVTARLVRDDDPEATHWGWLRTNRAVPEMVYPVKGLYTMCFPYGPAVEERHAKGRTLRLALTEKEL